MKKSLLSAIITLSIASSTTVFAEEKVGGADANLSSEGAIASETALLSVVGVAIAGGILTNAGGTTAPIDEQSASCNGDDQLVDGVCISTSVTSTVTGTGTITSTITVPITSTYVPLS